MGSYDAPAFTVDASCPQTMTYTNTVTINNFINNVGRSRRWCWRGYRRREFCSRERSCRWSLYQHRQRFTVVLEKVGPFHAWATGLGSDEEVVVDILEGSCEIRGDNDIIKEGEGAVMELSLNTLKDLLLEWKIEKVEDDALVLAEEFTTTRRR